MPTYGNRTYGNATGSGMRQPLKTVRSSWFASVEEKTSVKGTKYLKIKTEKNMVLWAWHPPTIAAILGRKPGDDLVLNVKMRDGFARVYIQDRKPAQ